MHHHCTHDHHPPAPRMKARFALAAGVNGGFVAVEAAIAFKAGSLALLADAGHNAADVLGLLLAWAGAALAARAPSARFTYGMRGASIMAALLNALLLVGMTLFIGWDAVVRLGAPEPVAAGWVMGMAAAGLVVNGATALLFQHHHELNARAAFLHLAGDAAASAGVVLAGGVMLATGWMWPDAAISLALCALILYGAWGVLRDAVQLALAGVPRAVDSARVKALLHTLDGVAEVHDLHIWGMSTSDMALSAHLVMPGGHPGDAFLHGICARLREEFGIAHATLQIELGDYGDCLLAPEHVI